MRVGDFTRVADSKPLYALIGANSAMMARFRELPTDLSRLQEDVQGQLRELPLQVSRYATELGDKATQLYADLADRGHRVVGSHAEDPPSATDEGS